VKLVDSWGHVRIALWEYVLADEMVLYLEILAAVGLDEDIRAALMVYGMVFWWVVVMVDMMDVLMELQQDE